VSVHDAGFVTDLFNEDGSLMMTENGQLTWNVDDLRFPGTKFTDSMGNEITEEQTATSWVPDADSTDGLYQIEADSSGKQFKHYLPIEGSCPKDGKPTGPGPRVGDSTVQLDPSRYCVRVKKSGFATGLALRAAAGYFVTRDVSLALITRFQFSAGEGDFSHLLLGGRVEYMFTKTKPLGLMVSGFLGGTFGQIQAQPTAENATGNEPWIKSGLMGVHIGSNVRYRFHPNFGVFMAPEFDLQFPTLLWNIDFAFLGVEGAL
jgi:hypothetical protein